MNNKILLTAITFIAISTLSFAQTSRVMSLGGLTYTVSDPDHSLNLYDFGDNPAWLINDETAASLKIMPSYGRIWGDYKRTYDFGSADQYGVAFSGIKPMGASGTFLGYTAYNYDRRHDVYRTLKHDAYAGEAFNLADTTSGNVNYNGPKVGFKYSFGLLQNLYAGVSISYGVMDGLKDIYSSSKTLLRDVNGKIGFAYQVSDNLVLGSTAYLTDVQESLEMASVDGTDVEIYNFRGETYAIKIRKPSLNQKIRRKGKGAGGQIYASPFKNFELAVNGSYNVSGATNLLPNGQMKEYEEGYASFENYNLNLKAKYLINENFQLGLSANYFNTNSWSKNSFRDLLLWEWKLSGPMAGIGGSYYISSMRLLVGAEFEVSSLKADSSKYIDVRYTKLTSNNNLMRFGVEYEAMPGGYIRAGYNYGADKYDLIYGGADVKINYVSFGLGYQVSELVGVDLGIQFGNLSPKNTSSKRDKFNAAAAIKILSF